MAACYLGGHLCVYEAVAKHHVCVTHQINTLEEPFLTLNCSHLKRFSPELYGQLVRYPQEVVPVLDMAVNELFVCLYPDTQLEHQIQVRTYNAEQTKNMRLLNPEDIDQLITISGMVIRLSPLMPEMRMGEQPKVHHSNTARLPHLCVFCSFLPLCSVQC